MGLMIPELGLGHGSAGRRVHSLQLYFLSVISVTSQPHSPGAISSSSFLRWGWSGAGSWLSLQGWAARLLAKISK